MACLGCNDRLKKMTNMFAHEDLTLMFKEVTGIELTTDYFICDECRDQLSLSYKFRNDCLVNFNARNSVKLESEKSEKTVIETIFVNADETCPKVQEDHLKISDAFTKEELDLKCEMIEEDDDVEDDETEFRDKSFEFDNIDQIKSNELYLNPETGKMEHLKKRKLKGLEPETRRSYTAKTKIEIVKYAEIKGNRSASRVYNINESSIRGWRKQKDQLLQMESERRTFRKGSPYWPELERDLKIWVENERNLGRNITSFHIKIEALRMARQRNINNFSGTKKWCYSFMKRNNIAARTRKLKNGSSEKRIKHEQISIIGEN